MKIKLKLINFWWTLLFKFNLWIMPQRYDMVSKLWRRENRKATVSLNSGPEEQTAWAVGSGLTQYRGDQKLRYREMVKSALAGNSV